MAVESMVVRYGSYKPKKKPQVGDIKYIKGVKHVRQMKMVRFNGVVIGSDCTNGRQRYEWVKCEAQ